MQLVSIVEEKHEHNMLCFKIRKSKLHAPNILVGRDRSRGSRLLDAVLRSPRFAAVIAINRIGSDRIVSTIGCVGFETECYLLDEQVQ